MRALVTKGAGLKQEIKSLTMPRFDSLENFFISDLQVKKRLILLSTQECKHMGLAEEFCWVNSPSGYLRQWCFAINCQVQCKISLY